MHREVIGGTGVLAQEREAVDITAAGCPGERHWSTGFMRPQERGRPLVPAGAFFLEKASAREVRRQTGNQKWEVGNAAGSSLALARVVNASA